ncbi:MAG: flagellar M-ring protein FliF C-terminal domain-containing protein [Planctomycetota bacterium]|jgi:flagellar biosynthesis/type III secretory pathway M-ring protein FliF/YscJ
MEVFEQLGNNARGVMREMSVTQRLAVIMTGITVATALGMMVFIGSLSKDKSWIALPMEVKAGKEHDDIAQQLKDHGIDFKYEIAKERILVPTRVRDKAYMLLASENLFTEDSHTGFEDMLTKITYSTTQATQRDMMRVALQNELSKMITSLEMVDEAKVVIDGGRKKVLGAPIRPRASVKISTRKGKKLNQKIADTIVALVSAAKAGLEKKNIVVVDQEARHFYAKDDDSMGQGAMERLELQRREERIMRDKIEEAVRSYYPRAEAFAFVNVEFDLDKKASKTHDIREGQIQRKKTHKQDFKSTEPTGNEVGVNPNISRNNQGEGKTKITTNSIKDADLFMENGYIDSVHEVAPGDVKEMTVSVVMHLPYVNKKDEEGKVELNDKGKPVMIASPKLAQPEVQELAGFISKSIGLASLRDVSIRQVEWTPPIDTGDDGPSTASFLKDIAVRNLTAVVLAGLAVAGLIMIWSQVKRVIPSEELASLEEEMSSPALSMIEELTDDDKRNASFEQMREKVADFVAEDPRKAASLVKRWLTVE